MNDINYTQHFAPFIVEGEEMEEQYQQIIATDSFFVMTFMPWSSSVWFAPTDMRFDDGRTEEERRAMLPIDDFVVEDIDGFIRAERGKIE